MLEFIGDNIGLIAGGLGTLGLGVVAPYVKVGWSIFSGVKNAFKTKPTELSDELKAVIRANLRKWFDTCDKWGTRASGWLKRLLGAKYGNLVEDVTIFIIEESADRAKKGLNSDD